MISKALQLGGGDWSIYGLQDQGFSNSVRENAGSFRVKCMDIIMMNFIAGLQN